MQTRERKRADIVLVARNLVPSRQKARDIIAHSKLFADGILVTKAGQLIDIDADISLDTKLLDYVSRGGLKLATALDVFDQIDIQNKICLDLGASTGGFSDVLLQRGAAYIYAVDVGHGQLADKMKKNPKIVNLEKTNARDLSPSLIDQPPSVIVCDVSFISLKIALPPALILASENADLLALIKPQFEVGKAFIGKGGIVRSEDARQQVETEICRFLTEQGWHIRGICPSPIKGPDGNQEVIVAAYK
ncbi:MAG: TlyA family RNA methyltransferase [Alphaproteobacteria bacterium]|nr:TlyA family RNA methyltransferase [Alphaproteobacteria bacterium]